MSTQFNVNELVISLVVPIFAIILSFCYFKLTEEIYNNSIIRRLVCPCSGFNRREIFDRFMAYLMGFTFYSLIYINVLSSLIQPINSKSAVALIIFVLLFLGRWIANIKGTYYGKAHFSALFASSSFATIFSLFNVFGNGYESLNEYFMYYINFFDDFKIISIVGCFILATIGELLLSRYDIKTKSILGIIENIPNIFRIISGDNLKLDINTGVIKSDTKLNEAINKIISIEEVSEIKVASKTLGLVEVIITTLSSLYNYKNKKVKIKILKAPQNLVFRDYVESIMIIKDITRINTSSEILIKNFLNSYQIRLHLITNPPSYMDLQTHDYYFGNYQFIITEYINGGKNLLILFRDPISLRTIGLSAEDPLVINIFENAFNDAWKISMN